MQHVAGISGNPQLDYFYSNVKIVQEKKTKSEKTFIWAGKDGIEKVIRALPEIFLAKKLSDSGKYPVASVCGFKAWLAIARI